MNINKKAIYGSVLKNNGFVEGIPYISIPGMFNGLENRLNINNDILSKHILMTGGTGSGKTNAFYHIIGQLKEKMSVDDIMIIFDTKGDYYNKFKKDDDLVIGNSRKYRNVSQKWNIFREILSDGWSKEEIENNVYEISWSFFREAIEKSKDPFFPNAARDLFAGILLCLMETGELKEEFKKKNFYNIALKQSLDSSNIIQIKNMIEAHPRYSSVSSYIGDGKNGQSLGIYAEMISNVRKIFTGVFADKGSFSVRDFVRSGGGKTLFIEYDLAMGNTLSPIYSLLIDLALKEVLGHGEYRDKVSNVYMVFDEFRLLPYLQHIDDAVNFGRSMGLKVLAGVQSINQMTELYGEYRGKNILSGFSSVFSFRANDVDTRNYAIELYGKNYIVEQKKTLTNVINEEFKYGNVVEDWDIRNLKLGEAIIGFPFCEPFIFQFDKY